MLWDVCSLVTRAAAQVTSLRAGRGPAEPRGFRVVREVGVADASAEPGEAALRTSVPTGVDARRAALSVRAFVEQVVERVTSEGVAAGARVDAEPRGRRARVEAAVGASPREVDVVERPVVDAEASEREFRGRPKRFDEAEERVRSEGLEGDVDVTRRERAVPIRVAHLMVHTL